MEPPHFPDAVKAPVQMGIEPPTPTASPLPHEELLEKVRKLAVKAQTRISSTSFATPVDLGHNELSAGDAAKFEESARREEVLAVLEKKATGAGKLSIGNKLERILGTEGIVRNRRQAFESRNHEFRKNVRWLATNSAVLLPEERKEILDVADRIHEQSSDYTDLPEERMMSAEDTLTMQDLLRRNWVSDVERQFRGEYRYLGKADHSPKYPISGRVMVESTRRIIFPMVLSRLRGKNPIWVFFLRDSGSPTTYVTEEVMRALHSDVEPTYGNELNVLLHGHRMTVVKSNERISHVNILGNDWCYGAGIEVREDWFRDEFTPMKPNEPEIASDDD